MSEEDRPGMNAPTLEVVPPPTMPGAVMRTPGPPFWHKVFGAIAIVFGSVAVLQGVVNAVFMPLLKPLFDKLTQNAPLPQPTQVFGALEKWSGRLTVLNLAAALVAGLLLAGGIGLLRRRSWSRLMVLLWAGIKMLLVCVMMAVTLSMQKEVMSSAMASQKGTPLPPGFMMMMLVVGAVFGIVWGWALPIVVMWWFNRARIREAVSSWPKAGGAA